MSDNEHFEQTWWDENLEQRYSEFESWVGPKDAISKTFFRLYIKEKEYKSLIDLGCGNATEYSAYKEEYPDLKYLGVDSSRFLFNRNTEKGIPMFLADADDVPIVSGNYEVVFSRHVLEHQPTFKPVLNEMIRLAGKEAIHVFFIIPREKEIINFSMEENLFHNTYCRKEIEEFLENHEDVESFTWIPITNEEEAISIIKKTP